MRQRLSQLYFGSNRALVPGLRVVAHAWRSLGQVLSDPGRPVCPPHTVCYWRGDQDKSTRNCVTVQDGDAVTYVGTEVVKAVGG